jgi:hypothetical protein
MRANEPGGERGFEGRRNPANSLGLEIVFRPRKARRGDEASKGRRDTEKEFLPFSAGLDLGVSSHVNASVLLRPMFSRVRAGASEDRNRGGVRGWWKAAPQSGTDAAGARTMRLCKVASNDNHFFHVVKEVNQDNY